MRTSTQRPVQRQPRNERGAALITTLLIATLLLGAGGALVLSTSMSVTNATDSTAEMQAYYGAEAGLQSTLNVLRGNVGYTNGVPTATPSTTILMTFRNAADTTLSNATTDTGVDARLSAWLNYSYKSGTDWRVPVSGGTYSPINGIAYSVTITAPDEDAPAPPGDPAGGDNYHPPNPKPNPLPPRPAWHQWHCGHCQYDYSHHASCLHKHCIFGPGVWTPSDEDYSKILVNVTGYGPKGAVKKIQMMLSKVTLGMKIGSVVTMVGASDGASTMTFNAGPNNHTKYRGADKSNNALVLGGFGIKTQDQATANTGVASADSSTPKTKILDTTNYPGFLQNADSARSYLTVLKQIAQSYSRYFTSLSGDAGASTAPAFTFVDGDYTLTGGAGFLVVTGTLTMNTNPNFDGLIFVLGQGTVIRSGSVSGGGTGSLNGALFIAKFARTWPSSENGLTHPFLAPSYTVTATGDSTFQFDSTAAQNALTTLPSNVVGVVER